jgi:predicted AAA+ superfamily ATPase
MHGQASKHYLADPALSAHLLGLDRASLMAGKFLGQHFEALAALSIRVFAQACEGRVSHLRTKAGGQEVDFVIEKGAGRFVACEVKATESPNDNDVRHLLWLKQKLGDQLCDIVLLTTGSQAYRRADGVAVVPLALLGP